jgi:predicted RNA-binding Zn-ribbon protein involved in translation (DUF1610 family)
MTTDEGPSPEDRARFGRDTGYCPECGEEIWDQAPVCPACGSFIEGATTSRKPIESWFRQRMIIAVAVVALLAFVLLVIGPGTCGGKPV